MKLRPRKKTSSQLGSLQQLADPDYLPKKRNNATVLERYCEMLETQINSLATKIISVDLQHATILYHPETDEYIIGTVLDLESNPALEHIGSAEDLVTHVREQTAQPTETEKALREARVRINAASNELSQAQQYFRDKL